MKDCVENMFILTGVRYQKSLVLVLVPETQVLYQYCYQNLSNDTKHQRGDEEGFLGNFDSQTTEGSFETLFA